MNSCYYCTEKLPEIYFHTYHRPEVVSEGKTVYPGDFVRVCVICNKKMSVKDIVKKHKWEKLRAVRRQKDVS